MSETIVTPAEADAHLEQAHQHAQEAASALDVVTAAEETAQAERARLDALPVLDQGDLLNLENARRYLRTLEAEHVQAEAAHVAALAALADAERVRARSHMHAAHVEAAALVVPIEKVLAKLTEKARAQVVGLRERVDAAKEWASQADEPAPSLGSMLAHLASIDPEVSDGALLAALGAALDERDEMARLDADTIAWRSERAAEASRAEAERAAFDALPQAERDAIMLARFDEAVERLRHVHPGYQIDAARRLVARGAGNPYGPVSRFNPYQREPEVVPVEVDEATENRRLLDQHHEAKAEAVAMREASGDYDPFASR